jgi:hypothetical protein
MKIVKIVFAAILEAIMVLLFMLIFVKLGQYFNLHYTIGGLVGYIIYQFGCKKAYKIMKEKQIIKI